MTVRNTNRQASGFTILELLLVLALLVTVTSLAAPTVGRTLDSHRLRSAGDEIRIAWSKARVRAMEKGRTYVFQHEPTGTKYRVESLLSPDDYLESDQLTGVGGLGAAAMNSTADSSSGGDSVETELPENVQFAGSQVAEDMRGLFLSQSAQSTSPTDTQWSSPVYFYPDGTTSTAKLRVVNQREKSLEISMRGLTGVVYVKSVSATDIPVLP